MHERSTQRMDFVIESMSDPSMHLSAVCMSEALLPYQAPCVTLPRDDEAGPSQGEDEGEGDPSDPSAKRAKVQHDEAETKKRCALQRRGTT